MKNRPDVDPLLLPGGRLYERRKCICEAIDGVDGLSVVHPEAAFYIFPRIDAKRFGIQNDEQFVLDFCVKNMCFWYMAAALTGQIRIISVLSICRRYPFLQNL